MPFTRTTIAVFFYSIIALGLTLSVFDAAAQPKASAAPNDTVVLKPLLDVLKDEKARTELIQSLERATGDEAQSESDMKLQKVFVAKTVATKLATTTKSYVDGALSLAKNFGSEVANVWTGTSDWSAYDSERIVEVVFPLAATLLTTVVIWIVIDLLLRRLLAPLKRRLLTGDVMPSVVLVVVYNSAAIVALAIAYAVGNVFAVTYFGGEGVSIYQALYLNAFAIFGGTIIVIRLLTGSVDHELGLIKTDQYQRDYIRRRSRLIAAVLIFGIAFLVPALNVGSSFSLARGTRFLVFTTAAILSALLIRWLSQHLQTSLSKNEETDVASTPSGGRWMKWFWPLLGYAYVAFAYIVALTMPYLFVDYIGGATLKTMGALVLGSLTLRLLANISSKKVTVPDSIPLDSSSLSKRLSLLFPMFLKVAWLLVAAGVITVVLDAWKVFDVSAWLNSETGSGVVSGIVSAFLVLLVVGLIWVAASSWIDQRIEHFMADALQGARKRTLYSLMRSALTVVLFVFGGMIALSELGVDIGPLLAGAGVLGLAVGFGAQKLVQDIISGVFIQLENAMNVGDVVQLGGTTGTVEHLTLRSASLRDVQGVYHIIPFSSMNTVSNYMRGFSYHVAEIGIAYKEKVEHGKAALQEAYDRLAATEFGKDIIAPLEVHGVTALGDSAVTIRSRIKTIPGKQFALGRAYTELVKEVMDERDIEIPFPHTTLFLGRDKTGKTDEFTVRPSESCASSDQTQLSEKAAR